jgi:hypothetical protein
MRLTGWAPSHLSFKHERRPFLEWAWFGEQPFTEPSYEDEIAIALRKPFALLFRREMPLVAVEEMEFIEPTGFIFHISHCDSTLISQMLATLPSTVVISESPMIDGVLQAWRKIPGLTRGERLQWLRWIIRAHGQPRTGRETRYFLKLDSWHIHDFPLIREAFPATPWIFVFCDPAEAIASQMHMPDRKAAPGIMDPQILGLTFLDFQLPRAEWCARILEKICDSALSYGAEPQGLFVGHRQLPEALWTTIAPQFGLPLDASEVGRMRERAGFGAKTPGITFDPAGRQPHDGTPALKEAYAAMQRLARIR